MKGQSKSWELGTARSHPLAVIHLPKPTSGPNPRSPGGADPQGAAVGWGAGAVSPSCPPPALALISSPACPLQARDSLSTVLEQFSLGEGSRGFLSNEPHSALGTQMDVRDTESSGVKRGRQHPGHSWPPSIEVQEEERRVGAPVGAQEHLHGAWPQSGGWGLGKQRRGQRAPEGRCRAQPRGRRSVHSASACPAAAC